MFPYCGVLRLLLFFFALIPPGTKKLSLFHYFQKMCGVVVVGTWVIVIPYVVIGRFLWFSLRCQLHICTCRALRKLQIPTKTV